MLRTPAQLIESHMNYWYGGNLSDKPLKLLTTRERGAAITRATVSPFVITFGEYER